MKVTLPGLTFRKQHSVFKGTQREYSSKPPKHRIVKRILVFKRHRHIFIP